MEVIPQPIWKPSSERIANSALTRFMHFAQERYHAPPVRDYAALHLWSVEFPENFWSAVWEFCEVTASHRATHIMVDGTRMPGAKWFVGAQFNYS